MLAVGALISFLGVPAGPLGNDQSDFGCPHRRRKQPLPL